MLAIIKTGGKQYSVKTGQILRVEKLDGKKGDNISFKNVLAVTANNQSTIGAPLVEGVVVEAKILDQIRDKKILVFKKRRRQNYRLTKGHRQFKTILKIESITMGGKKTSVVKKERKEKEVSESNKKIVKKTIKKTTSQKKVSTVKKTVKKRTVKKQEKKDK